jgi:hypothetical protein
MAVVVVLIAVAEAHMAAEEAGAVPTAAIAE